jgi:hypothetical protein
VPIFSSEEKRQKRKMETLPEHILHPARLSSFSSFSSFFQLILWHKALVALYLPKPKQRVRMS